MPFLKYSYIPERWKVSIHSIFERVMGRPYINKGRNIQIIEADLNVPLKIIWRKKYRKQQGETM